MASIYLGRLGGSLGTLYCHQLFAPQNVYQCVPLLALHYDVGFLPLRHLASNWRVKDIRLPICEGSVHHDLYALPLQRIYIVLMGCISDNGTGAPAGWNWILSL